MYYNTALLVLISPVPLHTLTRDRNDTVTHFSEMPLLQFLTSKLPLISVSPPPQGHPPPPPTTSETRAFESKDIRHIHPWEDFTYNHIVQEYGNVLDSPHPPKVDPSPSRRATETIQSEDNFRDIINRFL
jgi:hypothetical protein